MFTVTKMKMQPARVPILWRGGAQACLLGYAAPVLALGVLDFCPKLVRNTSWLMPVGPARLRRTPHQNPTFLGFVSRPPLLLKKCQNRFPNGTSKITEIIILSANLKVSPG